MSSSQQLLLGEGAGGSAPVYIEDVFSTYLWTGNGSTQTITNNIDLSTKGGMVWIKSRSNTYAHRLFDTTRGATKYLASDAVGAEDTNASSLTAFTSSGFSVGASTAVNDNAATYASWAFREQPKFFDVVTFSTTSGSSVPITVNHNLGSVPGCIIVKTTNISSNWSVYHRSLGAFYVELNSTDMAQNGGTSKWYSTPTSTSFTLGGDFVQNATYVAYVFAHNAGGFGLTGTDNVISCGSYTGNGSTSGNPVTLGFEPQWLLIKQTSASGNNWVLVDTMRGIPTGSDDSLIYPNTSGAEAYNDRLSVTSTGFSLNSLGGDTNANGSTYIYIAIRRGPMKVPTSGTSVFSPNALNAPTNGTQVTTNFPVDLSIWKARGGSYSGQFQDRLRGLPSTAGSGTVTLYPESTAAESSNQTGYQYWNTGFKTYSGENNIWWTMGRAPSFMDITCWIGNGTGVTVNHNLTVAPELIILKSRSATANWVVRPPGAGSFYLNLNNTNASTAGGGNFINNPTATTFTTGDDASVNTNGVTYVAYLFATCAGVSKVGTYTGTGSTLTVDCGFAGGARFVMIKRSNNSGNWFVWDTARGMVAGTDPRLVLNTTAAEANSNWVYTVTGGFQLVEFDNINISGSTYIFLAIA